VVGLAILLTGLAGVTSRTAALAASTGRLGSGEKLTAGQFVMSPNNQYKLIMQGDGNLVLYACSHALWSTKTGGHSGAFAIMQTDGNLVVYPASGPALWATPTQGHPGAYLAVQDQGNLVIYPTSGSFLWTNNTVTNYTPMCGGTKLFAGQSVLSPNGAYKLIMQGDGNLVLYESSTSKAAWNTGTGGNSGAWMTVQATDGHIVVYSASNTALWASALPAANPGAFLTVQNSGNLVEYTSAGTVLWQAIGLQTLPMPSWWKSMNCSYLDASGNPHANGTVLGSWMGLVSCGPGTTSHSTSFSSTPISVTEWQCVELSERWLYQQFGLPMQHADGNRVAPAYANYIAAHPSANYPLVYETPSSAGAAVGPGDVMSYNDGVYGHTAVVTAVTSTSYTILSENWSNGTGNPFTTLKVVGGVPQGFSGYSVVGWLHVTV
jgi:hypothetical protein